MTITDIIRNEIENSLGHNPSKEELSVMMDYIHDAIADKINADKKVYLVDIEFEEEIDKIGVKLRYCFQNTIQMDAFLTTFMNLPDRVGSQRAVC